MNRSLALIAVLLLTTWTHEASCLVPQTMSYQGVLTDAAGIPLTGSHNVSFTLRQQPVSGSILWQEDHVVTLNQGGFSVILGSIAPIDLILDRQYYLSIRVDGAAEVLPRTPLTASPYSLSLYLPFSREQSLPGPLLNLTNTGGANVGGNAIRGTSLAPGEQLKIGYTDGKAGVYGANPTLYGVGVHGVADDAGKGILGKSSTGIGVSGESSSGTGVLGKSGTGLAGQFSGNVRVFGTLTKTAGSFRIDHPLDPANKYLSHSFVESPDMMNIYNGNANLDAGGEAWIEMPSWFETLNMEFRYQLTAIGAPGPNLYVAQEITSNRFRVAGGTPGGKVSWLVTGIRHDLYAKKHRIPVEEDKPSRERGRYLHPDLYGVSAEQGIGLESDSEDKDERRSDLRPAPTPFQAVAPGIVLTSRVGEQKVTGPESQK